LCSYPVPSLYLAVPIADSYLVHGPFPNPTPKSNNLEAMSKRGSVVRASLGGILFGGAVGFGLGLLLAPDEGKQMRQRVAYLLDSWGKQVSDLVDEMGTKGVASQAREKADAVVADAREQAQEILGEAEALMSEARQRRAGESHLRRAS
jgi:gas vesicle protein